MEGPPRPFLPRAAKTSNAGPAGPNAMGTPPPLARQGCRGPQDLPCARPITVQAGPVRAVVSRSTCTLNYIPLFSHNTIEAMRWKL